MKLRIEIDMSNDAFQEHRGAEVVRILRELLGEGTRTAGYLIDDICHVPGELLLRDVNGNTCGSLKVTDD